jgi:3D (Asp-Asp-Asp) domain-containing protein
MKSCRPLYAILLLSACGAHITGLSDGQNLADQVGQAEITKLTLDEQLLYGSSSAISTRTAPDSRSKIYADSFTLPELDPSQAGPQETLWATWYNLYQGRDVGDVTGGVPLKDLSSSRLGPILSKKDWCFSAMEGSALIENSDGSFGTYNYAGINSVDPVDCSQYFSHDVSRTKFRLARGQFGDGVADYNLAPFRTIAVDKLEKIPFGTVLYIESARGTSITLPTGATVKHDGYFFAADTGGAIKGTHIDVFLGLAKVNPFPWVKSKPSGTFRAITVNDPEIIKYMHSIHE